MEVKTQQGYLVLADISGYTAYLAGVELDHAHEILTDLLETIVGRFKSLLTISKLEGDAVFGYVPQAKMPRGETLLELIESTYVAFRDRREAVRRRTTCECKACRSIPALDLKFMAHHGDYIVQNVSGIHELVGSDVNLVHRLMKNHVGEATGWKAYALFTDEGLKHMGVRPEGTHAQIEAYEHLGEVKTFSLNLQPRYAELTEARRVFVAPEEAYIVITQDFPAPPPVVWMWMNDPYKRAQYAFQEGLRFDAVARPGGRTQAGARNHCMHGKKAAMVETVLDWRPFDYLTVQQDSGPLGVMLATCQLEPLPDGGTRLHAYTKGRMGSLPAFLTRPLFRYIFTKMFPMPQMYAKMARLMAADAARDQLREQAAEPSAAPATA